MAAIGAGVLGLLCLSSSVYSTMSGGGDEEIPDQTIVAAIPGQTKAEAGSTPTRTSTGAVKGQYVRLWQGDPYQSQKAYALTILELEVYDSSGTNIAQGKSATARSQYSSDHKAVSAFDGSLDTKYYSSHDNKEDWIEIDLGSVVDIHKIVIRHPDSEDVYEGVAIKDRLRGYIEIFDGDQTIFKTEQIEETSIDHVYTYNFKERGGGKWRGEQGILRSRADLIAEKQAADAATADAEQKRLASVAVKAAADKAAADKAAAEKAADEKAAKDLADAKAAYASTEAGRVKIMNLLIEYNRSAWLQYRQRIRAPPTLGEAPTLADVKAAQAAAEVERVALGDELKAANRSAWLQYTRG